MSSQRTRTLLRLFAVACFSSSCMWAQFTSQIEGTVFDQSRSIVPTSTVTLENVDIRGESDSSD